MSNVVPWTKTRKIVAALVVVSLLVTAIGLWIIIQGISLASPSPNNPADDNTIGGVLLTIYGSAMTLVGGLFSVAFLTVYAFIMRSLRLLHKSPPERRFIKSR